MDDFLSIFDRTPRPQIQQLKTAKHEKTVSSENSLKTPSIKSVHIEPNGQPWNSGVVRRIPYSGALALLAVLLCAVADAIILWKSDGQAVQSWSVSPSVLLAILSALANVCLQYAHSQGVVIAWWRKALHGGKLEDLHHYWETGDGVWAAVTSGRGFNLVSLATLVASAVVFDGPLLQRASTVVSKSATTNVNVTAPIAEELPYGYTGYGIINSNFGPYSIVMNQTFAQVVNAYTTRAPITTAFTGCVGNCSGTIKAAGLAVNCSIDAIPWNSNQSWSTGDDVFISAFNWIPAQLFGTDPFPNDPLIDFNLQYITGRSASPEAVGSGVLDSAVDYQGGLGYCNGTRMMKRCSMRSATLVYPILLVNNTLSISGNSSAFPVDHLQAVGDPSDFFDYHDMNPMSYTTLGGIAKAAQNMFNSNAFQSQYSIQINGSLASQYLDYGSGNTSFFTTEDACAINWYDPTSDIVNALNEIMFRTALGASNVSKFSIINESINAEWTNFYEAWPVNVSGSGIPVPQILPMIQTSDINVFESHYSYLAAALALLILGILVVVPTFHGFWELGRAVSLNPLEVAKAFNAEMLQGEGSNVSVSRLMKSFGEKEIQYGEVIDQRMSGIQGLGIMEQPRFRGRRLELADPSRVREPVVHEPYL
jgi:hypothetical protein